LTPPASRTGLAALLEAMRAPLLLSPAADVYAGWLLVIWVSVPTDSSTPWHGEHLGLPEGGLPLLALSALAGCLLLAAGMAQNAVVDRAEDAELKPERPIPRGAIGVGAVRAAWVVGCLGGVAALLPIRHGPVAAGLILLGTSLYHLGLKRQRVLGCVVLGLLRGTCMALGVLGAKALLDTDDHLADTGPAFVGCAVYALYIFGASLHASTDDEPRQGVSSPIGLTLCGLTLGAWAVMAWSQSASRPEPLPAIAGLVVLLYALVRLVLATRRLPPPAVTGVALSGLHLLHAGVAALVVGPAAAAVILLLFGASRAMLKVYPPS
jgi:4-hydroxybenzoate polyprenyltransferase